MTTTPEPLVPAEVDLKGLGGFVLDINRLFSSELFAIGCAEEKWAAFMLWCRAWQQTPAGSLPNDERVLAAFSDAGKRWSKVKTVAMRGFILCADGRLYHPVVCEQVMKAWKGRQSYIADQKRLQKWREKRRGNGDETQFETHFKGVSETPMKPPMKPPLKPSRNPVEGEVKVESKQLLDSLSPRAPVAKAVPKRGKTVSGLEEHVTTENGIKFVNGSPLDETVDEVLLLADIDPDTWTGNIRPIIQWLVDGYEPNQITRAVKRVAERSGYVAPGTLNYFDKPVRSEKPAWHPVGTWEKAVV